MESIVFNERNQSDDGSTLKVPLMAPSESLFSEGPSQSPILSVAPSSSEPHRGETQPNIYRDVWAAVLFVMVQIALFVCAVREITSYRRAGLLRLMSISTGIALLTTFLVFKLLMKFMDSFLQLSIMLSMIGHLMVLLFCLSYRYYAALIPEVIFFLFSVYYVIRMQRRIPFAAANLRVALTAISLNGGLLVYAAAITMVVHILFGLIWLLAFMGQYHVDDETCSKEKGCVAESHINPFTLVALLFAFYWTKEVGKNVVHVTTAGVMGTYWFAPDEATTFWSPAIHDSYVRATSYSLGSICLGSLITSFLQTMHDIVYYLRHTLRRTTFGPSIVLCMLECMTGFLERVVSYFNKWAYVYIGLYGYDYISAGNKVMTLFMDRGWSTIINDQIVSHVLTLISILIGILSGCGGLLLCMAHPNWVHMFGENSSLAAFFLPALMGLGIAHIVMSVVTSAVDTVVVAFAEAPLEFERNHPGLSSQLVTAWRHVYPDEFV